MKNIIILSALATLTACGYKGDLYLPRHNDTAQFGVIQTGIEFKRSHPKAASEPSTKIEKNHDKTM